MTREVSGRQNDVKRTPPKSSQSPCTAEDSITSLEFKEQFKLDAFLLRSRDTLEVFDGDIDLRGHDTEDISLIRGDIFGNLILKEGQTVRLIDSIIRGEILLNGGTVFLQGKDATETVLTENLGPTYDPLLRLKELGYISAKQIVELASIPDKQERFSKTNRLIQDGTVTHALGLGIESGLIDIRHAEVIRRLKTSELRYEAAAKILADLRMEAHYSTQLNTLLEVAHVTPEEAQKTQNIKDREKRYALIDELVQAHNEQFLLSEKINLINSAVKVAVENGVLSVGDAKLFLETDESLEEKSLKAKELLNTVGDDAFSRETLRTAKDTNTLTQAQANALEESYDDPVVRLKIAQEISALHYQEALLDRQLKRATAIGLLSPAEALIYRRQSQDLFSANEKLQEQILGHEQIKEVLHTARLQGLVSKEDCENTLNEADTNEQRRRISDTIRKIEIEAQIDTSLTQAIDLGIISFHEGASIKSITEQSTRYQSAIDLRIDILNEKTILLYLQSGYQAGVIDQTRWQQIMTIKDRALRWSEASQVRDLTIETLEARAEQVLKLVLEHGDLSNERIEKIREIRDPITRYNVIMRIGQKSGILLDWDPLT